MSGKSAPKRTNKKKMNFYAELFNISLKEFYANL